MVLQTVIEDLFPKACELMCDFASGRLEDVLLVEVKELLWAGLSRWLEEDLSNFAQISKPELEFSYLGTKGVIDIEGILKEKPGSNAYLPYAGRKMLIDWKTSTTSVVSDTWAFSYLNSWQWRIYSSAVKADLFTFRGLSRQKLGETKSLLIKVPSDVEAQVQEYLRLTRKQMSVLEGEKIWPRNWPSPCAKFGGCPFYANCFSNEMPEQIIQIPELLSYSKLSAFQDCPEKYRRLVAAGPEVRDENENTIFGNTFHLGIAFIYEKVFLEYGLQH